MKRPKVAEFLIRTVLDDAFRAVAMATPDAAFEGFELSDDEKEILRRGDERVLELLGRVVMSSWESAPAGDSATSAGAAVENSEPTRAELLPEIALGLKLVPQAVPTEQGTTFQHAATLSAWSESSANSTDQLEVPAVQFVIRIQPLLTGSGQRARISYSARIDSHPTPASRQPLDAGRENIGEEPKPIGGACGVRHFVDSAAAKDAARAVLAACKEDRFDRLLDLARALVHGDAQ